MYVSYLCRVNQFMGASRHLLKRANIQGSGRTVGAPLPKSLNLEE